MPLSCFKVYSHGFDVPDVQIPVGLRREPEPELTPSDLPMLLRHFFFVALHRQQSGLQVVQLIPELVLTLNFL